MKDSEVLWTAANRVRAAAKKATPARWKVWGMQVMADTGGDSDVAKATLVANSSHESGLRTWNADYIATMDPTVGLALATMLENSAKHAELRESHGCPSDQSADPYPLAVAEAILKA